MTQVKNIKVLAALAEQVMEWTIVTGAAVSAHLKYPVCWLRGGTVLVAYKEGQAFKPWNPFIDPAQALELAEAWCRQKPVERAFIYSYVPPRAGYSGQHQVHLTQHLIINEDGSCWPIDTYTNNEHSLAKSICDAVCAAKGIEVEE